MSALGTPDVSITTPISIAAVIFALSAGVLAEALGLSTQGGPASDFPSQCCGPNCVYVLLKMHGIQCKRSDLVAKCNPGDAGCSIAALQACSEAYGLRLRAVTIKREDLTKVRFPAIAHVGEPAFGHYLVLLAVDDSTFASVDGTSGLYHSQVALGDFLRQWAGVLVVPEYVYTGGVLAGSLNWLVACLSVANVVVWPLVVYRRWIVRREIRPRVRSLELRVNE